jgi:integrating conjugative element protein (TIGR03765 family)
MFFRFLTLILIMLGPLDVLQAEPVVIYDNGRTKPLPSPNRTYLKTTIPRQSVKIDSATGSTNISALPVSTPSMSPGRVKTRNHNLPTLQPFFIAGADELSIRWLKHYSKTLKSINAQGFAANVKNQHELDQIIMACDCPIHPVQMKKIADKLALKHYPVLISKGTIEQ